MEFLQRHLPRVYQAVQDALNFFTNVTAQMFGAPPNAPRPRDARTNVPIQTTKESGGLLAKEETQDNKGTCQVTSTLELSQATEENGASGRCHPGDENHGTWETDLIHRKSDPGGTQDLDHKITKGEDIVLHTTVEVTTESYKVEVREFTESINIVTVSQDIQSIFDQEQVNPLDQRLEQENQASSIPCEIKVSQYEEELFHRTENLTDKAPLRNSERKVSKDEEHFRERSSDSQKEESFFQPATLYSLSSKNQKQLVDIIGQEEGKMTCLTEITTESEEYNKNTDEEAQVLVDTIESTVTMEYDVNNILDVIETHKKLVTPADDIEYPPYSQEDSNKTLEDLVETANRLAKHYDSFKKTGNQKGFDTLPDSDETSGSAPAFALLEGQGCTEEDLTSMDASLAQNTFSTEQSESTQTSSEEESMKAQSLVPELSRFSEETNTITLEEGKDMSTKFKEKHQFKESETQPKVSKNKRTKRRVHFSPSTEDLFLRKSEQASRNTLQMVCDKILEGELQRSRENSEQLGSSYITKDLGSSPDKDGEEDYLGGGSCGHDDGQSTIEEQMNVVKEGRTMWYDDYSSQAEYDERCESLGDVTNQNEHFKMEESFMAVAETTSTEEHLDDIPSGEDTLSVVTSILEQTKLSAENKTESHAFQEDNFEKEYLIASDEATEAAFKEDPFLQEAKSQVDGLREERTYLLKDDTTYVKESIDDISQSSNMLDTKDNGLQKDFIDELIQLDDRDLEPVIPDENNPAEDIDNTQLEIISHYSTYKHVTETGSSAEYEAQKEFTSDQLSLQKNDKDFKSKQDEAEVEEDLTKYFPEKVGSSIVQLEEDTSLGQPVSRSSDDECPEKLSETQVSTLVDEICMSVVEDVISGVGLPSEEHKDFLRDANFQGESETLDEISTHEMEEEEEYMNEKQNYDYKHEGFPPETIGSQEESKVKTVHIEPLTEHDEAEVQEDLMKSFQEQVGSSIVQLEEDTSLGQPVSRNSDDECSEILSETQVSTLVDLICMSVEEDVVLGGGLPSEEHSNILSDANLEDISSHEMEEKEEYMNEQHNYDYKHERFPPETNESQDEDRKVKTGPIEPLTEQCVAEEQHVADTEASLEEGLGNKQMQDDNEECPKECYEMDQSASLNEVRTSMVQDVLIREGLESEECFEIFKDVNCEAQSEPINEITTCEVPEHTLVKKNDDDTHEDLQIDDKKLQEEDSKVNVGHTEVEFVNEEQFGTEKQLAVHNEHCTIELLQGDRSQEQPVFRDSNEVGHKEWFETEQSTSTMERCTSIVEDNLKKEQVSEECKYIIQDISAEIEEIMTSEVLEPTSTYVDDYICEPLQPDTREPPEEDIKVSIGHAEIESLTQDQFVFTDEGFPSEGSRNDQPHEDRLLLQPIPDEPCTEKLHVAELRKLASDVCTSIADDILIKDSLAPEDKDVLEEVSLKTESKPHSGTSTCELHELEQHSDEELNSNYLEVNEDSLLKICKSQGDDSKVNTAHLEVGHLTEEKLVAEKQFEVYNEASVIEASKSDHFQTDILLGQPDVRVTDEQSPENLPEIQLSVSVDEIHTSIAENILIEDGQVGEEWKEALREEGFEEEGISCSDISTEVEELQDHTAEEQKVDHINAVHLTATSKSQEDDSGVNTGHLDLENVTEGHTEAEEQFEVYNEVSVIEESNSGHFQKYVLFGQPDVRVTDEQSPENLPEIQLRTSVNEIDTSIDEDFLIEDGLVSEEWKEALREEGFEEEVISHSETSTEVEELQDHTTEEQTIDYINAVQLTETNKSQEYDIGVNTGHLDLENVTEGQTEAEEQLEVYNEASVIEGSNSGHFQKYILLGQPDVRVTDEQSPENSHKIQLRTSVNEIHTSIDENILIEDGLVSEEWKEALREEGFEEEVISHSETSTEVEELQDHTTEEQTVHYINAVQLTETSKSQEYDIGVNTGHLDLENVSEGQAEAEERLEVYNEYSVIEGSNSGHFQKDILFGQPDVRVTDEQSPENLHETQLRTSVNEMHTSIHENVLVEDGLVSEEWKEALREEGFEEEVISHSETSTEVEELQDHTTEEQTVDYINAVQLTETSKDIGVNIGHLDLENVTEGQIEAEEQFEVNNEASSKERPSTSEQEDRSLGQPELRDSETMQSTSISTSVVETILITKSLMSEECSEIIKDADFKSEKESCKETTTYEIQEHKAADQSNDYTHEDSQLDSIESQVQTELLDEEQFVGEQQLMADNEGSATEGSCNSQLQEETNGQPVSKDESMESHQEWYETEQNISKVEMCISVVEGVLIKEDLVSEELNGAFEGANITSSESLNETTTCGVQEHAVVKQSPGYTNDFQSDASESQVQDSKDNIDQIEVEYLTEEQFVVTDEEESSNDQLHKDRDELFPKILHETEQSALVNAICTLVAEDSHRIDNIGSEEQTEAGLLQESESNRGTSTYEVYELQEHTAEKKTNDHIYEVALTEASKAQGNDSEVNTVELEEHIIEEHFVAEEQFKALDKTYLIEGSNTDQLQEDELPQTVSKESDEEFYGIETSTSVMKICTSMVDDILRESLLSEELSGIIKETHFKSESESHHVTTTYDEDQSAKKINQDPTHDTFQPKTHQQTQEEYSKLKDVDTEGGFLTEVQFVVTDTTSPVEGSSKDQLQEDRLSEKDKEVFREEHSKTDSKSDSETSTCRVEELQEHTAEKHNDEHKEQLVFKNETSLPNEDEDYTEEEHRSSNDTNNTKIKDSEEYKTQFEQGLSKLIKESDEEKESYYPITDGQYDKTGHTNILDSTTEEETQVDQNCQSQEKELDLLSEIHSIMHPNLLDQGISMSSEGPDAGLDLQNDQNILASIAKDSGQEVESYVVDMTEIAEFKVDKASKSLNELDLLSEIHCTLSPDHTVHTFPEMMDDLDVNGEASVPLEDQSGAYTEDQDPKRDLDGPFVSHLEGQSDNNDMDWRSDSDPNYTTSKDLLLEIQSAITADHTVKTPNFAPSVKLVESDVMVDEEVDEKAETEYYLPLDHSEDVTVEGVILETSMMDNEQNITLIEKHELIHEVSQVQAEVHQEDSHFGTVVGDSGIFENVMNLDTISTLKESEISLPSGVFATEIDNKSLTETSHTQQEMDVVIEGQPSASEETTAIYLNEDEDANTEHRIKQDNLPIIQTSCLEDIIRGQEQLLVDETGMSNAVQEEDEFDSKVPFHNTLDVSAQKSRILLLRKTSVRRRPGQHPVTFQEQPAHPSPPTTPPLNMGVPVFPDQIPALSLAVPPSIESSYPAEEPTDTSNASEPILRRKSSVRRRGQRPATYQEELAESFMSGITSTQPTHPTEEPGDESTISEQILHRTSSIRRHQGQRPVSLGDNPVEPSLPVIMPLKMEVPNFVGGMPILSPAMAPTSEPSHPAKEPMDEGTTSEQMLRRKSSIRRSKVKKSVISEEQLVEPTQSVTAPLATVASQPVEELKEEKTGSEELAIKPKKGFLKHAGFGGAHPGMMQELQARLHKKKPKE